jgi:cobalamin biosynthesis Mg chelatase CobN
MTTVNSPTMMSSHSTAAPSSVTTITSAISTSNLTTQPSQLNITSQVSQMSTQQTTNVSSHVPTSASTSPPDITSQSTMTSSPSHSIPHTTPRGTTQAPSPSKKKFNAWSFLGGVAVGLLVTLMCIGLVYFIKNQRTFASGSVQYRAMA